MEIHGTNACNVSVLYGVPQMPINSCRNT